MSNHLMCRSPIHTPSHMVDQIWTYHHHLYLQRIKSGLQEIYLIWKTHWIILGPILQSAKKRYEYMGKKLWEKEYIAESGRPSLYKREKWTDIRNLVSFAAANHIMISTTSPHLIINTDATQCKTSGDITKKFMVKVSLGRNSNTGPLKSVISVEKESLPAYFIKYYMVFTAGGSLAPPFFIVADDNTDANITLTVTMP